MTKAIINTLKIWLKRGWLAAFMLLALNSFSSYAQNPRIDRSVLANIPRMESQSAGADTSLIRKTSEMPPFAAADTISGERTDSVSRLELIERRDSAVRADSIAAAQADSLSLLTKSSLESPAFSTARDSIIEDFTGGKQMIYYYGDVTVTYGNMKLTADYMEYDLKTQTLFARGTKDTTGVITGMPEMT